MKHFIAITTALALTACSTSEMVSIAASECDQIGYAVGSIEHTQCTERGYRNIDAEQDAAIGAAFWLLVLEAAY
jgi:hypothetical protein